jgi:hypothetical protein
MNSNLQKTDNYMPENPLLDSVCIKFGKVHYRIQYDQIAYLYKVEGIFFLVDKHKLKLPLFMDTLNDFPMHLGSDLFFMLSDNVIVSRGSVSISDGFDESIAIASNTVYKNKFQIPKHTENNFRFWLFQR